MGPFKDGWVIADVEKVIEENKAEDLLYVPIVISMDSPNYEWSEKICISLSSHENFNVRGNAILGFSHLARTSGKLNLTKVLPIVSNALSDQNDYVRGHAQDTAEDIKHYLKTNVPGYDT